MRFEEFDGEKLDPNQGFLEGIYCKILSSGDQPDTAWLSAPGNHGLHCRIIIPENYRHHWQHNQCWEVAEREKRSTGRRTWVWMEQRVDTCPQFRSSGPLDGGQQLPIPDGLTLYTRPARANPGTGMLSDVIEGIQQAGHDERDAVQRMLRPAGDRGGLTRAEWAGARRSGERGGGSEERRPWEHGGSMKPSRTTVMSSSRWLTFCPVDGLAIFVPCGPGSSRPACPG